MDWSIYRLIDSLARYQLHPRFGPIGVSLGAMFNDAISVFAVTLCLLWLSFSHALCALFPYYYGHRWIVHGMEVKRQGGNEIGNEKHEFVES
jgi:hypothetical protein